MAAEDGMVRVGRSAGRTVGHGRSGFIREEHPTLVELLASNDLAIVGKKLELLEKVRDLLFTYEKYVQRAYDEGEGVIDKMLGTGFGLWNAENPSQQISSSLSGVEQELKKLAQQKGLLETLNWPAELQLKNLSEIAVELGVRLVDVGEYPLGYSAKEISEELAVGIKEVEELLREMETDGEIRVLVVDDEKYYRALSTPHQSSRY